MNYRMTSFILGRMLGVEALVMVIPAIVSAIYGEETMRAFLITSAVLMVLFLIFGRKKPENAMIYAKEGFVIVALAWILWYSEHFRFIFRERYRNISMHCLRLCPVLQQQVLLF